MSGFCASNINVFITIGKKKIKEGGAELLVMCSILSLHYIDFCFLWKYEYSRFDEHPVGTKDDLYSCKRHFGIQ